MSGAILCCGVWASHCGGFSYCGAQALECWLSICGSSGLVAGGMQDLPGPVIEPVSPALAGRFLVKKSQVSLIFDTS